MDRRSWSKINAPKELVDLLAMLGRKRGYGEGELHRFIYEMARELYPDEVETLEKYIGVDWKQEPPTTQ